MNEDVSMSALRELKNASGFTEQSLIAFYSEKLGSEFEFSELCIADVLDVVLGGSLNSIERILALCNAVVCYPLDDFDDFLVHCINVCLMLRCMFLLDLKIEPSEVVYFDGIKRSSFVGVNFCCFASILPGFDNVR